MKFKYLWRSTGYEGLTRQEGFIPMQWLDMANDPIAEANKFAANIAAGKAIHTDPVFLWNPSARGFLSNPLVAKLNGYYSGELTAAWIAQSTRSIRRARRSTSGIQWTRSRRRSRPCGSTSRPKSKADKC